MPSSLCPRCGAALAASAQCAACALEAAMEVEEMPAEESLGQFGEYDLVSVIARGGMGVVYLARQRAAGRMVALKMIAAPHLAGEVVGRRFRAEAEAVAGLEHPHIVPLYDAGEVDGQLFFTMRLMEGGTLAEAMQRAPRQPDAALFGKVARAIHYAHERGVLHRDLKPANILLDSAGEPGVADFGLALRADAGTRLTMSGAAMGTPDYMAPEQASGKSSHATTAADIYSLGAMLYEWLTGRPPFAAPTPLETMRRAVEEEPARPSSIHAQVDRDLETIAMRCLEKDPAHRYATAAALADDLERHLRGEPIHARPAGNVERIIKWARRRPAAAALIAVSIVAAGAVIALLLISNRRISQESAERLTQQKRADAEAGSAKAAAAKLRTELYAADMAEASRALDDGNNGRAVALLDRYRPGPGESDERGWEWRWLWGRTRGKPGKVFGPVRGEVNDLAWWPDGKAVLVCGEDFVDSIDVSTGEVFPLLPNPLLAQKWMWQVGNMPLALMMIRTGDDAAYYGLLRQEVLTPSDYNFVAGRPVVGSAYSLVISSDGSFVGTNKERGYAGIWRMDGWHPDPPGGTGMALAPSNLKHRLRQYMLPAKGGRLAFHPRSPVVAAGHGPSEGDGISVGGTTIVDIGKQEAQADFPNLGAVPLFSPDGSLLAIGASDRKITVLEWPSRKVKTVCSTPGEQLLRRLAITPDNKWLLAIYGDGTAVRRWEVETGKEAEPYKGHAVSVRALTVSPSGQTAASAGADQTVRLWDIAVGTPRETFSGHTAEVRGLAFSPDGKSIASSGLDKMVRLWPVVQQAAERRIHLELDWGPRTAFSPDSRHLIVDGTKPEWAQRDFGFWDLATQQPVPWLGFSEGGTRMAAAACSLDGKCQLALYKPDAGGPLVLEWWEFASRRCIRTQPLADSESLPVAWVAAADGSVCAIRCDRDWLRVWRLSDGKQLLPNPGNHMHGVSCSPQGTWVGWTSNLGAWLMEVATERKVVDLKTLSRGVEYVTWSPDERFVTWAGDEARKLTLLESATGRVVATFTGHSDIVRAVAFSPDGRLLASLSDDLTIRLWHLATQRQVGSISLKEKYRQLCFSPDGKWLAVGGHLLLPVPSFEECEAPGEGK